MKLAGIKATPILPYYTKKKTKKKQGLLTSHMVDLVKQVVNQDFVQILK